MSNRLATPLSRLSSDLAAFSRRKFDDRAQTWLSVPRITQDDTLRSPPPEFESTIIEKLPHQPAWKQSSVSSILASDNFTASYGSPTALTATSMFIGIGTAEGRVVGFNYYQRIAFVASPFESAAPVSDIGTSKSHNTSRVTCLKFSSASLSLVAGYEDGTIRVWDLPETTNTNTPIEPVQTVNPISLQDRFTRYSLGHLNVPITSVLFVSTLTTQFIASDVSGLIFYHHLFRRLMKKGVTSVKLFGRNDANIVSENGRFVIYSCEQLPLGAEYLITDDLAVFAILTLSMLAIVSILSLNNSANVRVRTHYTVGRTAEKRKNGLENGNKDYTPEIVSPSPGVSGTSPETSSSNTVRTASLNWLPGGKAEDASRGPKLIYTYNHTLTILSLDTRDLPTITVAVGGAKDKDKLFSTLEFKRSSRWNCTDDIALVRWISSELFMIFSESKVTVCHYNAARRKVKPISTTSPPFTTQSLLLVHESRDQMYQNRSVNSSILLVKGTLIILSENGVYFGSLPSWADVLAHLLTQNEYRTALAVALQYFLTEEDSEIAVTGLPSRKGARQSLVRPYMIRILNELGRLFEEDKQPSDQNDMLLLCIHTIGQLQSFGNGDDDYSAILDVFYSGRQDDALFFNIIIRSCLSGQILYLPPLIFKSLVEYAVLVGEGDTLTEIICDLDVQSLDIDLTLRLCETHGLRECSNYIWSFVLKDYAYPIREAIIDLKSGKLQHIPAAYTYMSFIFTGRQYPTDRQIDYDAVADVQQNVAELLFRINELPDLPTDEGVFPYLSAFLRFDSFEMLSCLHQFYESSFLNEERASHLSRQYIIDCLLDVYNSCEFSAEDSTNLAIFIARNYSKYSQFIRLSESVLEEVVNNLCNFPAASLAADCELALQSLLPHYESLNETKLMAQLKSAKFYSVLIGVYRAKGEFAQALNAWSDSWKTSLEDMGQGTLFHNLEVAYAKSTTTSARMDVKEVVRRHFADFARIDSEGLVRLNSKFEPSLHCESNQLTGKGAFLYLKALFSSRWSSLDIPEIDRLLMRYTSLLCEWEPGSVVKWIKENSAIRGDEETRAVLRQHDQAVGAAILLQREHKNAEAAMELVEAISALIKRKEAGEADDEAKQRTEQLELLAEICNQEPALWLTTIELFNMLSREVDENTDNNAGKVLRECVLFCFKQVSDRSVGTGEDSLTMRVLHRMIGDDGTVMAQFRSVVGDVFIAYSYEGVMLQMMVRIVNSDIQEQVVTLRTHNLAGWPVNTQPCTSCGKALCGPGVALANYDAFQLRQYEALWGGHETQETFGGNAVVLFNCAHGYHLGCLLELGWKTGDLCVLCTG